MVNKCIKINLNATNERPFNQMLVQRLHERLMNGELFFFFIKNEFKSFLHSTKYT